ncbi:PAS domain S-box protein [Marinomonas algarum]|uniref:Sensory/regulatory protein RpfC n=1 Tax=Marinomonas algarum TaxID=2883105 RepID=A0A9X1LDV3_9GAMM|nr:PAS domain S-box protein [Marinomonas algarum]MCB5160438.1 PAS domain S-box protein [Marinomonas algarum]
MSIVMTQRRTVQTLKDLHEVTADNTLSLDSKLQKILQVGVAQFSLPFGLISSIKGDRYRVEYSQTPNGEVLPGTEFELGDTYCVHTLQSDAPTSYFHTALSDIKEHPCYQNFGLEAYIGVVIYVGGERWGTLNFSSPDPKEAAFGEDDDEIMKLLAQWVGNEMTRHQDESRLKEAERHQRLILEAIHEGLFGVDLEGRIRFANPAASQMLGYAPDDMLGQSIFTVLGGSTLSTQTPSAVLQPVLQPIQDTLQTGKTRSVSGQRFYRRNDTSFACEYTCIALRSESGALDGAVISFQDRTEQLQSEQAILEQKTLFESLFVNAPEAVVLVGANRKIKMVNPAFTSLFGYVLEDVVELSSEILYSDNDDFVRQGQAYHMAGSDVLDRNRVSYKDKQGQHFCAETIGSIIRHPDGSLGGYIAHIRDVRERLSFEQKMLDTHLRLSIAADAAGIGVWKLDLQTGHLDWDDWMYRLYGVAPDEKVAPWQVWEASVYPEEKRKLKAIIADLQGCQVKMRGQGSSLIIDELDVDFRISRQDDQIRYLKSNASLMFNSDGIATYIIGVNIDITSQKETEVMLRKASEQALAASKAKSDFLATMSHEIRTPLNGVLGMAELLASSALSEEQSERLKILQESGNGLLGLINDLLDFSKIEAGQLSMECVDFDLEKALYDVICLLTVKAEKKGIELRLAYQEDCPRYFVGDVYRIKQIATNLIGNAIKFTHEGHVSVYVEGTTENNGVTSLTLRVEDTGVGIEESAQSALFSAFTQADSTITRKFGGTGLGLAITKQLIGLMQGEIHLQSQLGKGSTFTVTLALPESHSTLPSVQPPSRYNALQESLSSEGMLGGSASGHGHRGRVLVVEDMKTNMAVAQGILTKLGCEVIAAQDGAMGVELWEAHHPDLILMDLHMPVMDGLTAMRHIRQSEKQKKGKRVPILALTADILAKTVTEVSRAGGDGLIPKPFNQKEIIVMLDNWLPVQEQHVFQNLSDVVLDEAVLEELKTVLEDDFYTLVDAFFADADRIMDFFESLVSSGAEKDSEGICHSAHSLKSISRSMGAWRLSDMAQYMEHESREGGVTLLPEKLHAIRTCYVETKTALQEKVKNL